MLEIRDLRVEIAGSPILRGVSLSVRPGQLVCLLGRNGAGKTTTLNAVMGHRRASAGTIRFRGAELLGLRPHRMALMGIGFSPEESEVFADLTVAENIALPTWTRAGGRPAAERIAHAYAVFPSLGRTSRAAAGRFPGRKSVVVGKGVGLGGCRFD